MRTGYYSGFAGSKRGAKKRCRFGVVKSGERKGMCRLHPRRRRTAKKSHRTSTARSGWWNFARHHGRRN